MGLYNTSRYLRALIVLLPFGISMLYFGFTGLFESVDDLTRHDGIVEKAYEGKAYSELTEKYNTAFIIKLEGIETHYKTFITEYIETFNVDIVTGDAISLWTRKDLNIAKLKKGELTIVEYDPTTWVDLLILLIGIVYTTLTTVYLIKHPTDLIGGTDEEKLAYAEAKKREIEERENVPKPDTSKYLKYMIN